MYQVEKWGMLELEFAGRTDGNPFTDYSIRGVFTGTFKISLPGREYMAVRIQRVN